MAGNIISTRITDKKVMAWLNADVKATGHTISKIVFMKLTKLMKLETAKKD